MTTLDQMVRLVPPAFALTEGPGSGSITSADELSTREGYKVSFLENWNIELPLLKEEFVDDMLKIRRGGEGVNLTYQNFSVVMSASRRLPIITASNIDGKLSRRLPRVDKWKYDGRIDEEDQWGNELYNNNILDRGHMVRREDPVWGSAEQAQTANVDTFHFTNCCPQVAGVNQKVWLGLENYILDHARTDGMLVNVYTGPFFTDQDLDYRGARIPLSFWKVVAITTDGRKSATAYKVSQEKELADLEFVYAGYKTFQISIQQVMDNTNIDFSELIPFDGFSGYEEANKIQLEERLDTFASIRI